MSNNQDWDDDEFDFDDENEEPRSANYGNDLVKKLRKSQRQMEKRNKELEAELAQLRQSQREVNVKTLLEERGLNSKIMKFIPADIELSAESLDKWIEENGDVFGIVSEKGEQRQAPDLATLRQIDSVTANAITPDKLENMLLRLDQATSIEEVLNMINGS